MAGYSPNDIVMSQSITECIFAQKDIGCQAMFCWVPIYDHWELWLDITYQYLKTKEKFTLKRDWSLTFGEFIATVENIRGIVFREFELYFNALWC